ncbi:MAG: beta-ketoacyl-ACP synthase III [Candidatus Bipolaricaulia bacterium]
MANVGIIGTGAYVPDRVLTNHDLEQMVETSDEWIIQRTGIRERRILREDEDPSVMGIVAAREAIERAGIVPGDLDMVIVATNVPDRIMPGSAPYIRQELEVGREIPFFDVMAGCSGFIYALEVARGMIATGSYRNVLVVGADAMSRILDWKDRSTCVLFGDGAGAVVVSPVAGDQGILSSSLHGDSSMADLIKIEAGGAKMPITPELARNGFQYVQMEGGGVFKNAVKMMESSTQEALDQAGVRLQDLDWVAPHQANLRIIKSLADRLDVPMEKVLVNIDRYANTSAATIPLVLHEAAVDGRLKPGNLVVLTAFGAGAAYGAMVLRW